MKRLIPFACLLFSLAVSGCATKEKNQQQNPPEERTAAQQGERGAVFDIPAPATPEGQVKLVSVGVTDLRRHDHEEKVPALHLRMTVKNDKGSEPWLVDSRAQQVSFINGRQVRPAFVHAPGDKLPFINVNPGESKDIELYYVLPDGRDHVTELPGFALNWQVQAGSDVVTQSTPFGRAARDGTELSTFPTVAPQPKRTGRSPASEAEPRRTPPVGVESDWWMDPFADLPFPWSEQSPQQGL